MYVYFSPLAVSLFPLLYLICRYLDDWYRSLCLQCVEITAKIEEKLGKVTYTQVYSPCGREIFAIAMQSCYRACVMTANLVSRAFVLTF